MGHTWVHALCPVTCFSHVYKGVELNLRGAMHPCSHLQFLGAPFIHC